MENNLNRYDKILNDSRLKDDCDDCDDILEYLIENGYKYKLDIALKYYNKEELTLNEYSILLEFFNYIESNRLNELLYILFKNDIIFSINNQKTEEIISLYLRDKTFTKVVCGVNHCVALAKNGKIYCWKRNSCIQMKNFPEGDQFVDISCGRFHSVALDSKGRIYCWGDNRFDQLEYTSNSTEFFKLVCNNQCFGLYLNGKFYGWGYKSDQLNNPQGDEFIDIACGDSHSLALDSRGRIHYWGDNRVNQFKNVPQNEGFTKIACGDYHSVALDSLGKIHCWGNNSMEQLNNIPNENGEFIDVFCGVNYSIALDSCGRIHDWGSKDLNNIPDEGFINISCGDRYLVGICENGKIYRCMRH